MTTQTYGGLPPKNGPLSSSIGSVATITTIADKAAEDPDECGRVGGWVASFDKLLEDELGVHALLVSGFLRDVEGRGGGTKEGGLRE
jgi:hypothetical protein